MSTSNASAYRRDLHPIQFVVIVVVGCVASGLLSWLEVAAWISVVVACGSMLVLAAIRWQIARENDSDYQSLEAFAEDIYLLGYLLTLSAFLGFAPRMVQNESVLNPSPQAATSSISQQVEKKTNGSRSAQDDNIFKIAGMKLGTTVLGLALMMVFRQTARRWAEEKEGVETQRFIDQQRLFSEAVARLNEGADQLTGKLDEIVHRFDPALLEPLAEWSNRAAGAFSLATTHLEAVPASVLNGLKQLDALNVNLEQVKATAAELAVQLGQASQATNGLGVTVAALEPAGKAARTAIQELGVQADVGATKITEVSGGLHTTALELGKVERALKKLLDLHGVDHNLPLNRLVEALDKSAAHTTAATERVGTLRDGLQSFTTASQEVAKRIETHIGTPLAGHQEALGRVQEQISRAAEQIERVAKQFETTTDSQADGVSTKQLLTQLSGLQGEMSQTNAHFKKLLGREDGSPTPDQKTGFWGRITGGR